MNKRKEIFKFATIIIIVVTALVLFWSIKLQGYSMPIQHTTKSVSGEFSTTIGEVREIMVKGVKNDSPVTINVTVYSEDDMKIWQKQYTDIVLTGNYQTIDTFEKENFLKLPEGKYYVKYVCDSQLEVSLQFRFTEYSGSFFKIYFVLSILLLAGIIVICFVYHQQKMPIHINYVIIMLLLGTIYNFAFPPLGVPDEESHFLEAYKLSSKIMLQEEYDDNGYLMLRADDRDSILYLHDIASISEWYDSFEKGNITDKVPAYNKSSVSSKAIYAYFAPALGITFARIIGASGHMLLIFGRFANLLLSVLIVSLAIKFMPFGKSFYLVLGTLPEVVYLFTSYSYDGINLALCMLIVAYFLHLYQTVEKISLREIATFILLLLLLSPIKTVYIFFAVLLLLLPKEKIAISRKHILAGAGAGIVCICFFLILSLPTVRSVLGTMGTYETSATDKMTIGYALNNISHTASIYLDTIFGNTSMYFSNAMGEIVGRERYDGLDCYVMPVWMQIATILLLIIGLEDTAQNKVSGGRRMISAGSGVLMYFAVITSMLFAFTQIEARKIMGVQGRYFLPLFALVPIVLKNTVFELKHDREKLCIMGVGTINFLFVFQALFHYIDNFF